MNSYNTPGGPPLKMATRMEPPIAGQTLPTTRPTPARERSVKFWGGASMWMSMSREGVLMMASLSSWPLCISIFRVSSMISACRTKKRGTVKIPIEGIRHS